MFALISVALFAVAAAAPESSLKPQEVVAPLAPLKFFPSPEQRFLQVPGVRAAYVPQYYQAPFSHQTPYYHQAAHQYSGAYYYPQQYNSAHYTAPHFQSANFIGKSSVVAPAAHIITSANPASHAAPKPVLREYNHPQLAQPHHAILRQSLDNNFDGHFQYDFETENGIAIASSGAVKQLGPEQQAQVMQGSYSYTSPEGQLITTSYVADENGFVASGDHLPQAPEVPELPPLIAKSLAYIRSLPPQPENQQ